MKQIISNKKLRKFGMIIGFGLPIIIGLLIPFLRGHLYKIWTFWIGCPFLILGLIKPKILYYPYKTWIALGHILGWINSRIILGLVFILVLIPIAFIMKVLGYDPLKKYHKKNILNSYRELKTNKIDLNRTF